MEPEPEERRRRRRGAWIFPSLTFVGSAVAFATMGFVAVGPMQTAFEPSTVEPVSSNAPVAAGPLPHVSASPSLSPGGESVYETPTITIEPPPAPPKKGTRITTTNGSPPYAGYTSAQYCALLSSYTINPFSTSGSSATAFLAAANKERAQIGAPALVWNGTLATYAQGWSGQMASDQDAHPEWTWGSPEWYAGVFRHSGGPYAENIAVNYGYSNPVNVAQSGWMRSTGHCLNIMNPSYHQFGAGIAQADDGSWWFTEEFYW